MKLTRNPVRSAVLVGLALLVFAGLGAVATAADMNKAVDYRQNIMKSIGANAADIGLMLKGDVPFSASQVAAHAGAINALAKILPDAIPAGSAVGESKLKPEVFDHLDEFKKYATALDTESAKLVQIAQSGGDAKAVGAQVGVMGKEACGACHKAFRKPLQ
jgi:cytochrome c556